MRTAENSSHVFDDSPKQAIKIVQANSITVSWENPFGGCSDIMDADIIIA